MKNIIIGSTSINRPQLHNTNISKWFNWINNVDKSKYNLKWFINIDYIEKLEISVEETQKNYESLIKQIPLKFLNSGDEKGNFLKACQRVSSNIESYILENNYNDDDCIIIWLEDDWKLNDENIPLQELIENYLGNFSYINLSFLKPNYIHALAPSIISYGLWKKLHLQAWKNQKNHIDPEHCAGLYFLKHFMKYEQLTNITLINKYKKINKDFFNQGFLNYEKSYYIYDTDNENNIINEKNIKKKEYKQFVKDKIIFIRITSGMCNDIGRKYMESLNLIKDKKKKNFYD
jgi:hypothetical protein